MESFPALNFPTFNFRIGGPSGQRTVWDELRGCWLVLTPEEWVRRHLIRYLSEFCGASPRLISQECPVRLGELRQRADVVVFGRDARPLLLAECKSPDVKIDASTYAQAVRYNSVIGARYILVTNGLDHKIYESSGDGNYAPLKEFPDLNI